MLELNRTSSDRQKLKELIINADRNQANAFLDSLAAQSSYMEVIHAILEPVLVEIGNMWVKEELSLAQGYVSGKIAEDIFEKTIHAGEFKKERANSKGAVVMGNIEDDYHELGKRMVITFLKAAGWDVYDLGTDVMAEEFVARAIELNAPIIGVSAMMYSTANNVRKVRDEIDAKGLRGKILLATGGAVFNLRPELVHEVGADGTAKSAINAPQLFDRLLGKIK
jgi:methylmalonyl-CoA mutase cobalamin-binding domain/chain